MCDFRISLVMTRKLLHWVEAIPDTTADWQNQLRAALQRRTWELPWMKSWTWGSNVCSQPGRPKRILGCIRRRVSKRSRDVILSFTLETPSAVLHPVLGSPAHQRRGPVKSRSTEGHEDAQRAGASLLWSQAWESEDCSACRREGSVQSPYCGLSVLRGGYEKEGEQLVM